MSGALLVVLEEARQDRFSAPGLWLVVITERRILKVSQSLPVWRGGTASDTYAYQYSHESGSVLPIFGISANGL
jgi:hypothetical protein